MVKGWLTESGVEIASTGVQVHGGMGFIEETGAAQHLRDARITTIYEGTTAIQANDLVGRKIARDGGEAAGRLIATLRATATELAGSKDADIARLAQGLEAPALRLEKRWPGWSKPIRAIRRARRRRLCRCCTSSA